MTKAAFKQPGFTLLFSGLLTSMAGDSLMLLVLAVWVVAAETLHGTGTTVDSENGLTEMMERAIGPAGPTLMWCAIFFVVFDNIVTQPRVFVRMLCEAVYSSRPARAERIVATHPGTAHDEVHYHDRLFWWTLAFVMTVPVIFE